MASKPHLSPYEELVQYHPIGSLLFPLHQRNLISRGLLGPLDERGLRLLASDSTERSGENAAALDPMIQRANRWVPDRLLSAATFVILGFTRDRAMELWDSLPLADRAFEAWNSREPSASALTTVELIRAVTKQVREVAQKYEGSDELLVDKDNLKQLTTAWGIDEDLYEAVIGHQERRQAHNVGTCARWVSDAMMNRWGELLNIWRWSLRQEMNFLVEWLANYPQDAGVERMWHALELETQSFDATWPSDW